jgi:hypothetical protein
MFYIKICTNISLHLLNNLLHIQGAMANHSVCVLDESLPADRIYESLHSIVVDYLKKGYGVIYAAENDPPHKIIKSLAKSTSATIDVEGYVKDGALTIIDYSDLYRLSNRDKERGQANNNNNSNAVAPISILVNRWQSEIQQKRQSRFNQVLIVGTARVFAQAHAYDGLMAYEDALNHEFMFPSSSPSSLTTTMSSSDHCPIATSSTTTVTECICCYRSSVLQQISSLPVMASVVLSHGSTITSARNNRKETQNDNRTSHSSGTTNASSLRVVPLNASIVTESITQAMDDSWGNNIRSLILKTMNLIYHIDEQDIIGQPKLFVDTLVKIVGKGAATLLLGSILDQMKQRIFVRTNSKK